LRIQDYLFAIRRRLWLPITVPLAAAVVTAGVLYIQPEKYEATATVVVPALSAQGYSTSAVTQYVSTFKDVLVSAPVIDLVARQTGEKSNDLVAGLSASTATASSNIIVVTYKGPNKKSVTAVAEAAAVASLDALLEPQKARADEEVTMSLNALNAANKAVSDFTARTGILFPENDYKTDSQELSQLIVQLEQARLAGDKARVTALQGIVRQRQAELVALAPLVVQYDSLVQAQAAAEAVHNKAEEDLNRVEAEIASDHDSAAVSYKYMGHVSRLPDMLKFGGVAFAIAMLLALAFIVFMEFYRPAVAQAPYRRRLAVPASSSDVTTENVAIEAAGERVMTGSVSGHV
jgi:hypothetical protein